MFAKISFFPSAKTFFSTFPPRSLVAVHLYSPASSLPTERTVSSAPYRPGLETGDQDPLTWGEFNVNSGVATSDVIGTVFA